MFSRKKEERSNILNGMLSDYCKELEKIVHQYPEQWFWMHKRWKSKPLAELCLVTGGCGFLVVNRENGNIIIEGEVPFVELWNDHKL